ncbi:MAG: hypothetical protein Q8Q92_02630, partial [bacterium]|nr:hypothetical protein [bacterium]
IKCMKEHSLEENIFQETKDTDDAPKKQGLEIGPQNTELQETLETLHNAVSHDEPLTESNLADLRSAVEGMKITIGGKEVTLKTAEGAAMFNAFLGETNTGWGVKEENLPTFKFEFTDPKELDYKEKAEHPDQARFGEYTLNPETFAGDFEKAKVFIPDLSAMEGKKLYEVFKYVVDTFGEKYYVPGIEYWKWMIENPNKIDQIESRLKDSNHYFFPGSSLCDSLGYWRVPGALWNGGGFNRSADWLEAEWSSETRVLLLEK